MNRYWDLSEKERSELTEQQMESFITVELMEKGVVKVDPPELLPEETPEIPATIMYGIKCGYGSCKDYAWKTPEAAAAASATAVVLGNEYVNGNYLPHLGKSRDISVEEVKVYAREDIANNKAASDRAASNKKANEAARNDHAKACKAVNDAVEGVWEDYRNCQSLARRMKKIHDTFEEYKKTCDGNERIAEAFLRKAFGYDEVNAAFDWFGIVRDVAAEVDSELLDVIHGQ